MPAIIVGTAIDGRPAGQPLHRLVLGDRDQREVRLEGGGQELAQRVDHLVDPDRMVVDVAEVDARVVGMSAESVRTSRLHMSTSGATARFTSSRLRLSW